MPQLAYTSSIEHISAGTPAGNDNPRTLNILNRDLNPFAIRIAENNLCTRCVNGTGSKKNDGE